MCFIIAKIKETILDFAQDTVILLCLNIISIQTDSIQCFKRKIF